YAQQNNYPQNNSYPRNNGYPQNNSGYNAGGYSQNGYGQNGYNPNGGYNQNGYNQVNTGNPNVGVNYTTYTTKANDNLLTIAESELGDSTRWAEIRNINPDKNLAGSIPPGTVIYLPPHR
ncbi:MAG: hypothetical protein J6S75_13155, partial [Thermoguttaceae bacterium]|nr:hypothetical protein [Thermoguttaceae bacterium]